MIIKRRLTPEEIADLGWWECHDMPDCEDVDVGRCIDVEDYRYCVAMPEEGDDA